VQLVDEVLADEVPSAFQVRRMERTARRPWSARVVIVTPRTVPAATATESALRCGTGTTL
jgi:hypothetical protein